MSQDQLHRVTNSAMTGIHDVFPPDKDDEENAISLKSFRKSRALGKSLRMCWDLTLMVSQGNMPYVSVMADV